MSGQTSSETVRPIWQPQPGPQHALIECPVYQIFYGGARGGGKTDGVIGKLGLKAQAYGPEFNAVIFRREMPSADDMWERARQVFEPMGARCLEHVKTIRFHNGARIRFRPLERVSDAEKYQGQNLTDAVIEEAGNWPDPAPIDRLHAVLRGVPWRQMILTGNPGGPGQLWIKERFIDPHPAGMKVLWEEVSDGLGGKLRLSRVFIPSKVWDNPLMLRRDPTYVASLHMVGSEELVRAWLDGDWNAIQGAFFDCWRTDRHVIDTGEVPDWWLKFRAFDWGFASPFSVGWWAVSDGSRMIDGRVYPRGALIRYREWYGAKRPNVGLRISNEEIARGILEREPEGETITYSVADPSIFNEMGGPSIAEQFARAGVRFKPGDNRRVPERGAISGWAQVRQRLVGNEEGWPMIYVMDCCKDSIRTIPVLQHDEDRPEDLDTEGEDHAADEWRYACMSRPWQLEKPKSIVGATIRPPTFDEAVREHERRQRPDERI